MDEILAWFETLPAWALTILSAIVTLFTVIVRTRGTKKRLKEILEKMIEYRTQNYQDEQGSPVQTFSKTEPAYRLNTKTDSLEPDGDENVYEKIQSSKDVALTIQLNKLMPNDDEKSVQVREYTATTDKLDTLLEASMILDEAVENGTIKRGQSLADLYQVYEKKAQAIRAEFRKKKEDEKKEEVKDNETKNKTE